MSIHGREFSRNKRPVKVYYQGRIIVEARTIGKAKQLVQQKFTRKEAARCRYE